MWEHYPLNYFSKKLKRTVIDMSKILETQPEREAENDVIAISGNCCIMACGTRTFFTSDVGRAPSWC